MVTVLDGKGGVPRIVPFSASLHPWLEEWDARRRERLGGDHFFESAFGGAYTQPCVYRRFTKVVPPSAGIVPAEGQRTNAHGTRHAFACHALDAMAKAGRDTRVTLPYPSAYMGHKDVKSTEIYLRLTEDRLGEIVDATHHIYEGSPSVTPSVRVRAFAAGAAATMPSADSSRFAVAAGVTHGPAVAGRRDPPWAGPEPLRSPSRP